MTILTFAGVVVPLQIHIHTKFGYASPSGYGAKKSNMAANSSDLNELRKLDSPSTDIHVYEI